MKPAVLILLLAASTAAASAQPAAPPAAAQMTAVDAGPAAIPPVAGTQKTLFSLCYQEIKIGAGALAEPYKLYTVEYTGWLAADGRKFDSSYDHPRPPLVGKDGKPVLGPDGKPVEGPPQPIRFPQGFGRVIPGFEQGFTGMRIGGERRLFIPWELAYGAMGRPGPDAAHPGIPPKADLIFDVKLVDVTDLHLPPNHPGMMGGMRPAPAAPKGAPAASTAPAAPAKTPAAAAPAQPQTAAPAKTQTTTPAQPQTE